MAKAACITFLADKVLPMLKKCVDKNAKLRTSYAQPALDIETGLLLATNGHILAVHKVQDYRCEGIADMLYDTVFLPYEVVKMKGMVTVEIVGDFTLSITAEDNNGVSGIVTQNTKYPSWRSVIPRCTGTAIPVDAKAWTKAVKEMLPKLKNNSHYMELDALHGDNDILLRGYDGEGTEFRGTMPVVGGMPYGIYTAMNAKRLRDVLAFGPTAMHYTETTKLLFFTSEQTLVMAMPILGAYYNEPSVPRNVSKNDSELFDLDTWIRPCQSEPVDTPASPVTPLTLAEQLRKVLIERF